MEWRREVLRRAREEQSRRKVRYAETDKLEVVVDLYLARGKQFVVHDVDNRLKDVLDALQGPKGKGGGVIKNDRQICRVVMQKRELPKLFKNSPVPPGGYLRVRKLTAH